MSIRLRHHRSKLISGVRSGYQLQRRLLASEGAYCSARIEVRDRASTSRGPAQWPPIAALARLARPSYAGSAAPKNDLNAFTCTNTVRIGEPVRQAWIRQNQDPGWGKARLRPPPAGRQSPPRDANGGCDLPACGHADRPAPNGAGWDATHNTPPISRHHRLLSLLSDCPVAEGSSHLGKAARMECVTQWWLVW